MGCKDWFFLTGLVVLICRDLYCFIFKDQIAERRYLCTVEDVN